MGLPLETLDTWIDGLCYLMEIGLHTSAKMFPCAALPNTPIAEKEYGELYGIQYAQIYESNHTPFNPVAQSGGWDIVIGTKSMPHEDWKQAYMFKWLTGGMHWLGITQFISRYLRNVNGVSFKDFYWKLLKFAQDNEDTFIGSELKLTLDSLEYAIENQFSLGRVIKEVDEDKAKNQLIWDYDEATAINLTLGNNKDKFYKELRIFIKDYLDQPFEDKLWDEIVRYQSNAIITPTNSYPLVENFEYNIHQCATGESTTIQNGGYELEFNQTWTDSIKNKKGYSGDTFQFACEKLWWLRNRGEYKANVREL